MTRRLAPRARTVRRRIPLAVTGLVAGLSCAVLGASSAAGAFTITPGEEVCWTVSDSTEDAVDSDAPDRLWQIDRLDKDPETNSVGVGPGTGTQNIEAIALDPGSGPAAPVLFAADAGVLGTLDLDTGAFNAIGEIGKGKGSDGTVSFSDVDGLNFDPTTGDLYASHRRGSSDDVLLRIDPETGAAVAGAFDGDDYVVVEALSGLSDIDDLAIDPTDGQMYAIANTKGRRDHLVRIDKATGEVTDIGVLGHEDMEGLSFAPEGQLIGSTGKVHDEEGIWDLDKNTGAASNRRALEASRDYEGLACLLAPIPAQPEAPTPPPTPETPVAPTVETQEPVPVAAPPAPAPPLEVKGSVEERTQLPRTGPVGRLWMFVAAALFIGGGWCVAVGAGRSPRRGAAG